jgi:hypothetical protein
MNLKAKITVGGGGHSKLSAWAFSLNRNFGLVCSVSQKIGFSETATDRFG